MRKTSLCLLLCLLCLALQWQRAVAQPATAQTPNAQNAMALFEQRSNGVDQQLTNAADSPIPHATARRFAAPASAQGNGTLARFCLTEVGRCPFAALVPAGQNCACLAGGMAYGGVTGSWPPTPEQASAAGLPAPPAVPTGPLALVSNRPAGSPAYVFPDLFTPKPPVYPASFSCDDGTTPLQNTVCENPRLAALDLQSAAIYRAHLGAADVFERDQLLAAQRGWVLNLPAACGLSTTMATPASPASIACITSAYQARITTLTHWPSPIAAVGGQRRAIARYVSYKLLDDHLPESFGRKLLEFFALGPARPCPAIAADAAAALSDDGAIDPARLAGAQELAGSHGSTTATVPELGRMAVNIYRADLYGGYQLRARSAILSGSQAPLLGPTSVGDYMQTLPNGEGRYVSFASQTGDYGDIDIFTFQRQLFGLITDPIGYNAPAPPGEAAVAAIFTISQGAANPACLFETYLMPPPLPMGIFGTQAALTQFLSLIGSIQGAPTQGLAPSDRQDSYYFLGDTRWTMLNMPLVTLAQEQAGNWTGWLRWRHDRVLDSLAAWSQTSPENHAMFMQLFALLRPAATALETIYLQQQGLTPEQAQQATALAMMELLYQSTINFAPGLGGKPTDRASYQHYHPRYAILARLKPG